MHHILSAILNRRKAHGVSATVLVFLVMVDDSAWSKKADKMKICVEDNIIRAFWKRRDHDVPRLDGL